MKTIELRVGNLVKCQVSNDARIYSVAALDGIHRKVMLSDVRFGTWYDEGKIKPIHLTKELLLQLGFIMRAEMDCMLFERGSLCLSCYSDDLRQSLFCSYWHDWQMADVRELHQLQNLYFALTDEELDVNF